MGIKTIGTKAININATLVSQCEHIWQNFDTLAKFRRFGKTFVRLAIFWTYFGKFCVLLRKFTLL